LPSGVTGPDALIAIDARTGQEVQRALEVGGVGASSSAGYAGVALIGLAAIGVVLLCGSTLLVLAGRRRHATA
jgi:uncharacterized membrane protein